MTLAQLLSADIRRYPRGRWVLHRGAWFSIWFRTAQFVRRLPGPTRPVRRALTTLAVPPVLRSLGVDIGLDATIGPGLLLPHPAGLTIHGSTVLGSECVLLQGVTLGNRVPVGGAPLLGDRVEVGSHAQILGQVSIGDGAKIGALALVISDVPGGARVLAPLPRVVAGEEEIR